MAAFLGLFSNKKVDQCSEGLKGEKLDDMIFVELRPAFDTCQLEAIGAVPVDADVDILGELLVEDFRFVMLGADQILFLFSHDTIMINSPFSSLA